MRLSLSCYYCYDHVLRASKSHTRILNRSHICTEGGKWFVNPGSITGAFSSTTSDVVPSFLLMAIQGPKVVAFVYEMKGESVVVSKSEFSKEP